MSCGCQSCGCQDDTLAGFLGALSPDDAVEQVFPKARATGGAGHSLSMWNGIRDGVAAGQIMTGGHIAYVPGTGDCEAAAGQPGGDIRLAQTSTGLALTGLSIGLTTAGVVTAAALAPFTLGLSALVGLFPLLFGHHGKAVKQEQSVLCTAVPAANNYLNIIDQAVRNGYVTPQHGIEALDSLLSDFNSKVASIRHGQDPMSSGECNAACVMATELHAIVIQKESEYQDLIAGAAQSVTPARPNTTSPSGTNTPASSYSTFYNNSSAAPAATSSPNWFPIAAVAVAGFFLSRHL